MFYSKMLQHRFATAEELRLRGIEGEYLGAVVRSVIDAYYEINTDKPRENVLKCEGQFAAWWLRHRADFFRAPRALVADILDSVRSKAVQAGSVTVERITLGDWLASLEKKYGMRDAHDSEPSGSAE